MPRLGHGTVVTISDLQKAREDIFGRTPRDGLGFAVSQPVTLENFDFMFADLQENEDNLLPQAQATRDNLVKLGQAMLDKSDGTGGDSDVPAAYTYFGQFVDHDITLEVFSAKLPELLDPNLVPLPKVDITNRIKNSRTASLDLDSLYGSPAPRDGSLMRLGQVARLNGANKPLIRPENKDDNHDLPREPRDNGNTEEARRHDRAALIGDARNDENTIVAQLHVAFLRAHNALVNEGRSFDEAVVTLRQHYQHIVIHDFLKRIADNDVVNDILTNGNRHYDAFAEPFFMPLEFSVAAYRFGHSMIRKEYNFNLNFNSSGDSGTVPASLDLLFLFTALQGQLEGFPQPQGGSPIGTDTLPENWIIEWENMVDVGGTFDKARKFDTKLVEPLFSLRDSVGRPEPEDRKRLAVRNLLRGYLLRMPTGQAVARAIGVKPLVPEQIEEAASDESQISVLRDAGFLERTPLWYYVLAEAALAGGNRLGAVGSTIVAEVLIGLVRRSDNSILRTKNWVPTLPSQKSGSFTLNDLLKFAGVLA